MRSYRPYRQSVETAKVTARDENRIIRFGEEVYVPIRYKDVRPRIMKLLLEQGFLERVGRLEDVLKANGRSWEEYQQEAEGLGILYFGPSTITYKVLKDVRGFSRQYR